MLQRNHTTSGETPICILLEEETTAICEALSLSVDFQLRYFYVKYFNNSVGVLSLYTIYLNVYFRFRDEDRDS